MEPPLFFDFNRFEYFIKVVAVSRRYSGHEDEQSHHLNTFYVSLAPVCVLQTGAFCILSKVFLRNSANSPTIRGYAVLRVYERGHFKTPPLSREAKGGENMNEPMTAHIKSEQDERGLLPYPVIIAATKGDPEAMNIVVQHYESYIAFLSMRKLRDERGNIYYGIDEDIRDRLRSRLMRAVLSFKV